MPIFDTAEAATKHAIHASGKTIKEVAGHLWPARTVPSAQTHLHNCLNETRDEKLTADEHIAIANFCKRFEWLHYCAFQCSHDRPAPVTPEHQAKELQTQLFAKTDELRGLLAQIDLLKPKLGRK